MQFCSGVDTPVFGWIALRQVEFYKGLTASISAIKADGSAPWLLLVLSFAYGGFHAAGPGHGKAVITSYLIASGGTARRGVALSFAAALVQAVVAIVLVAVASIAFRVTAMTMTRMTNWLEIGSYALIVVVGAWLLWTKVRGGHHHHSHGPTVPHENHIHLEGSQKHRDHDHEQYEHGHSDHQNHVHARQGEGGHRSKSIFARPLSAILAVGVRPCSGRRCSRIVHGVGDRPCRRDSRDAGSHRQRRCLAFRFRRFNCCGSRCARVRDWRSRRRSPSRTVFLGRSALCRIAIVDRRGHTLSPNAVAIANPMLT